MKTSMAASVLLSLLLSSCASKFASTVSPNATIPNDNDVIAISFLEHEELKVSDSGTNILEKQLQSCSNRPLISAKTVDSILRINNQKLEQKMSEDYIASLGKNIKAKYLMTGKVIWWHKGAPGLPATNTEVVIQLTMYDLVNGKTIWSVAGQDNGSGGIFANPPEEVANKVIKGMLKQWIGFCKPEEPKKK